MIIIMNPGEKCGNIYQNFKSTIPLPRDRFPHVHMEKCIPRFLLSHKIGSYLKVFFGQEVKNDSISHAMYNYFVF